MKFFYLFVCEVRFPTLRNSTICTEREKHFVLNCVFVVANGISTFCRTTKMTGWIWSPFRVCILTGTSGFAALLRALMIPIAVLRRYADLTQPNIKPEEFRFQFLYDVVGYFLVDWIITTVRTCQNALRISVRIELDEKIEWLQRSGLRQHTSSLTMSP